MRPTPTTRSSSAKSSPAASATRDVKTASSLELADVVKKTASLGATYPQIVAILEAAKRQKNLAGELVVDAVPVSNKSYLEAVLGKDTTAKRDDSLKRASTESTRPARWRFFGLLGRDSDDPDKDDSSDRTNKSAASDPDRDATSNDKSASPVNRDNATEPTGDANAKKGDTDTKTTSPKKDDALQKANLDDTPPPRRRLFDLFRRDDEP